MTEIEEQIVAVVTSVLKTKNESSEHDDIYRTFYELDLDSLDVIDIVVLIDKQVGTNLDMELVREMNSPSDLIKMTLRELK